MKGIAGVPRFLELIPCDIADLEGLTVQVRVLLQDVFNALNICQFMPVLDLFSLPLPPSDNINFSRF